MAHVADEPQEPVVVDVLAEDLEHDRMVEAPETVSKVTLDEPARPGPGVGHLPQRGVAAPAGAKTVGAVGERRLVLRLKEQAHHFGDELVRPGRQAQRA